MSANIYYEFFSPNPPRIPTNTPSRFIKVMEENFGDMPCHLKSGDYDVVKGMASVDDQFKFLLDLLSVNESIWIYVVP